MPTSAPIHTQIVITTNPIFSIIMRRGCHGCQTKNKTKKKGATQKYPQSEVNFFLVPKPQETAVWSKAASGAVRQPHQGQLHTHGSCAGSRDFGAQEEASPDGPAEERLKKSQRTSSCFIPSSVTHRGADSPARARGVGFFHKQVLTDPLRAPQSQVKATTANKFTLHVHTWCNW